jgi:hypothetical protein
MRPENVVEGKTPTVGENPTGSAAGLGVTPAVLRALRKAIRNEDFDDFREIVSDYLADRGYHVWWEGLVLLAYASEAKGVIRALKELFAAAGIDADLVAWFSGGYGPVKIGLELPWGVKE